MFDLESLTPPPKKGERYSFTDPSQPGQTFEIELRPIDWLEEQAAAQLADQLYIKHVTGGWVDERGLFQKEPIDIDPVAGEPVVPNIKALKEACYIAAMQVSDTPYDPTWFCRFSKVMPNAWAELQVAVRSLSVSYAAPEKKMMDSTDNSPGSASTSE